MVLRYNRRMDLGERLQAQRKALRLSGGQVAAHLGVSSVHISDMENNKRRPSLDLLVRLARFYGVSTDYLLGVDEASDTLPAVPPRDAYADKLSALVGRLGEAEKAALLEIGETFQRFAAERQEQHINQFFNQMMGDVEREVGAVAAEQFYSAIRVATARSNFGPLLAWMERYVAVRTGEEGLPHPGE